MEDKILKLEEAVMSKCCSRVTDDMSQEYELIKKYSIIEYLSYQITDSNNNNKSHSVNNNSTLIGSVTSINKSDIVSHCVCSREPEKKKSNQDVQEKNKKKVIVTRDSTLNWTRWKKFVEKLSSETTADEVEQLVSCKSDCFFVGTNDLSKQINTLDNVRKSIKNVERPSPNTRVVFSNLILRRGKPNSSKKAQETKGRLKNNTTLNKYRSYLKQ